MTYWLGNCAPVHWMYQSLRDMSGYALPDGRRVEMPTGLCLFPNDIILPPPRSWLERSYAVAALTVADQGGHFPAMEQPLMLADDIRTLFRAYR